MGSTVAQGYKDAVDRNWLSFHVALETHLLHNHYPPLPLSLIDACMEAIEAGNEGDWDRIIDLPEEITYRAGKDVPYVKGKKVDENGNLTYATASVIIELCHLETFLDYE